MQKTNKLSETGVCLVVIGCLAYAGDIRCTVWYYYFKRCILMFTKSLIWGANHSIYQEKQIWSLSQIFLLCNSLELAFGDSSPYSTGEHSQSITLTFLNILSFSLVFGFNRICCFFVIPFWRYYFPAVVLFTGATGQLNLSHSIFCRKCCHNLRTSSCCHHLAVKCIFYFVFAHIIVGLPHQPASKHRAWHTHTHTHSR
jgi:hypothetical protein